MSDEHVNIFEHIDKLDYQELYALSDLLNNFYNAYENYFWDETDGDADTEEVLQDSFKSLYDAIYNLNKCEMKFMDEEKEKNESDE